MNPKITQRIGTLICAYMLAALIGGCASTSASSRGEWQEPRVRKTPYQTVLVVTAMPDAGIRRAFDQTLVAQINKGGAKGINAYALSRQMETPKFDREVVIAMARETGADAIIVTRVLDRSGQLGEHRGDVVAKFNPGILYTQNEDASMTSVMASNYWVEVTKATTVIDGDALVQSYLYELASGDKLIYRMTTQGNFRIGPGRYAEGVGQEFALKIAKQLRSDRVIR